MKKEKTESWALRRIVDALRVGIGENVPNRVDSQILEDARDQKACDSRL